MKRQKKSVNGLPFIQKSMREVVDDGRYEVEEHESNGFLWSVRFPDALFVESYPQLFQELQTFSQKSGQLPAVEFEITFPSSFPSMPPFIRVVRPRFQYRSGHITVGGSICTEDLSNQGWSSSPMTIINLMLFLQSLLVQGEAHIELQPSAHNPLPFVEYHINEAREAFQRVSHRYGWK